MNDREVHQGQVSRTGARRWKRKSFVTAGKTCPMTSPQRKGNYDRSVINQSFKELSPRYETTRQSLPSSRMSSSMSQEYESERKESENYKFINLRTSEIHLFYNLQLFYWHFLEILWLFIFLVFYKLLFFFYFLFPPTIIFYITNEISFTIISLSSTNKFFLEPWFSPWNYYYNTNYYWNLLRFPLYFRS